MLKPALAVFFSLKPLIDRIHDSRRNVTEITGIIVDGEQQMSAAARLQHLLVDNCYPTPKAVNLLETRCHHESGVHRGFGSVLCKANSHQERPFIWSDRRQVHRLTRPTADGHSAGR